MHRSISRIIILGDGLLGSEIQKQTGWDYISRKKDGIEFCNIETYKEYIKGYNTIVNCIAYTNTYSNNKNYNWNINYKAVTNLVDYCNVENIKLVHISTDYVYTNSISHTSENDIPIHGNNWYSYTKLLADAYIELKSKNYLICRGTHKPNPFPYDEAWIDQYGNFDYVNIIAKLIINLINSNNCGIFNVGTQFKSMFDLAKVTNENVKPVGKPDYVPKDISMDISKLKNSING